MSKPSSVIVVVEDGRHKQFINRYLTARGLENHAIRIELSPSGQGSAESWVRNRFVKEVKACRMRQAKAQTALIVVIDADTATVQHRLRQLDQALQDAGEQRVASDRDQIARLVAKRNIETWILCLNEQAVDEETDYKRMARDWSALIPPAAEVLSRWTRVNAELPQRCVDSLRKGITELNLLELS